MPQVQVLPPAASFGDLLAQAATQGAMNIGEGFTRRHALQQLQNFQGGSASPIQQVHDATSNATLPPKKPIWTEAAQFYDIAKRALGHEAAQMATKAYIEDQKLSQKEGMQIRAEERASERTLRETEQKPFFEEIARDRESLPNALQSNSQVIDAIMKGNVGPGSLVNIGRIASELGVPRSITKSLESTDSKEFTNGIKALMGHTIKDTFRGTTTQREIDIAEAMQAEIGVKPEANLAAAWANQSALMLRQEKLRLYDELSSQGVPRSKIPSIVQKQLEPYRKQLSDQYFQAIQHLREKGVSTK